MIVSPKKINLVYPPDNPLASELARLLADAFPGVFKGEDFQGGLGGTIFLGGKMPAADFPGDSLVVTFSGHSRENVDLRFGGSESVPTVFRNRTVKQTIAAVLDDALITNGCEIIASIGNDAAWISQGKSVYRRHLCAVSPERFKPARPLFLHLSGETFAQLLPVIDFIRHVTGENRWTAPARRANIMFDDPNLHSLSYGYIDYKKLVESAREHRYLTSFATIPLDAWFTRKKSAELFKAHPGQISLLVHGNNHLSNELANFGSPEIAIREMAQAFNRIRALEQKTGLEISKVVAAPHGACSEATLEILGRLGYEGACISSGSLCNHNLGKEWNGSLGVSVTEMIKGVPVMPRFRLAYTCFNSVLLAAYFNQPIVPVGHHEDTADGLKMVEAVADFINSLGEVHWGDMKTVCRGNFLTAITGDLLTVRPFTNLCDVSIPAGVTKLSVERPWQDSPTGLTISGAGERDLRLDSYAGESVPVKPGSIVRIQSFPPAAIDPTTVKKAGLNFWAFTRRQMCECRDRLKPRFN